MQTKIYAGRLKNREKLKKSSSGGAFTALSDVFLQNGEGIAASIYDYKSNELKFSLITDSESRDLARGSKYFQSRAENIFRDSRSWLESHPEKKLLFVGTGCQAEAFRAFMDASGFSSRIVTVDIICFGVVSPEFWRSYLQYKLQNQGEGTQCRNLTFKDKRNGWLHPAALLRTDRGEIPIEDYVKIFYGKAALRPSCYHCPYTAVERNTDITIGDFWGIDQKMPDFYDPMGNSLFLVHTKTGQDLFDAAREAMDVRESSVEQCMQSHLEHPTECPQERSEFWKLYREEGVNKVMKKYAGRGFYDRAKGRLKRILAKNRKTSR